MGGEHTRETTDRVSIKDAATVPQSASLSREVQDSFQPLQRRASNEQPMFLDFSLDGLYPSDTYTGISASAMRRPAVSETAEHKLDAQIHQPPAPEGIATAGVTRRTAQTTWGEATGSYRTSIRDSGTFIGLTDEVIAQMKANGYQKLELNDSQAQHRGPKVFERPANQAVEPMPPLSDSIKNARDASPVALCVQITNVPEVSEPVKLEDIPQHLNQAFEAGAQAVRPIEQWMATPNAVSDSLVSIGPALDNAVNYYANTPADQVVRDAQAALGMIGDALDRTFSFPQAPEERAKTAGEIMPFAFADGIGTQGESATFKTADAVTTHVDRAVMQIEQSLEAIKKAPDLAADIKQGLYEFLKGKGLTAQEVEYAGIPRGFFDDIQRGAAKDDTFFAMSKAEEGDGIPKRSRAGQGASEISYQIDKETGRLQRTDLGKVRQPYNWEAINERFSTNVIRQSNEDSCIAAVGEMLSEGKLTEQVLIAELGERPNITDLVKHLGSDWTWEPKRFKSFAEIGKRGPWAAELMENAGTDLEKSLHTVVVDGVNSSGNLVIRDPWEGTTYEMTQQKFLKDWTRRAVYRY